MKKAQQAIKETPPQLMPTGTKLSPERQKRLRKAQAAMKELIKERKKEKETERYVLEQRRKVS